MHLWCNTFKGSLILPPFCFVWILSPISCAIEVPPARYSVQRVILLCLNSINHKRYYKGTSCKNGMMSKGRILSKDQYWVVSNTWTKYMDFHVQPSVRSTCRLSICDFEGMSFCTLSHYCIASNYFYHGNLSFYNWDYIVVPSKKPELTKQHIALKLIVCNFFK